MAEEEVKFLDENGQPFEVPVDGSLGLLAMGHIGLRAWRKKRELAGVDVAEERRKAYEQRAKEVEAQKKQQNKQKNKQKLKEEQKKADNGEGDR